MKELFRIDLLNYEKVAKVKRRPSVRGIIQKDGKVALVYSKKYQYYKFPGGGMNEEESHIDTLVREVLEETGLVVRKESIQEYGNVVRRQASYDQILEQDNFYYFVEVEDQINQQHLDEYERDEEFTLVYIDPREAIQVNRQCKELDDFYIVMVERDTRILEMLVGMEIEPTLLMAHLILREGEKFNPGPWRKHSINVAKVASMIASKNGLDPEKAYLYGLLHDIGRKFGITGMRHVYDGYHYMLSLGYKNVAKICLTHSFNLKDIHDYIGKRDLEENQEKEVEELLNQIEFDDYDLLIQLCDSIAMSKGIVDIEERMNDVKRRYGEYPQSKWNRNLELKEYFHYKGIKSNHLL